MKRFIALCAGAAGIAVAGGTALAQDAITVVEPATGNVYVLIPQQPPGVQQGRVTVQPGPQYGPVDQAGTAFGQPGQPGQMPAQAFDRYARQYARETARGLLGRTLRAQGGEQVGDVTNVALGDQGRRIEELIVELPEGKLISVPWDRVRPDPQANRLIAQMDASELRGMEAFSYAEAGGAAGAVQQ